MSLPRVVYLSAPPHGEEMLAFLRTLPCEVVCSSTQNPPFDPRGGLKELAGYDLGLNFLGTRKIPEEEVNRPRLGWVNFHPAPLPEFGGRNVAFHAIESGAKEFGATVHYMDKDLDTGPLIEVVRFPIEEWDTAGALMMFAHMELKRLFRAWVPVLLKDRVYGTMQPPGSVRYFPKQVISDLVEITYEQEREIRARTCLPKHHAVLMVGGRRYKVVPE